MYVKSIVYAYYSCTLFTHITCIYFFSYISAYPSQNTHYFCRKNDFRLGLQSFFFKPVQYLTQELGNEKNELGSIIYNTVLNCTYITKQICKFSCLQSFLQQIEIWGE